MEHTHTLLLQTDQNSQYSNQLATGGIHGNTKSWLKKQTGGQRPTKSGSHTEDTETKVTRPVNTPTTEVNQGQTALATVTRAMV